MVDKINENQAPWDELYKLLEAIEEKKLSVNVKYIGYTYSDGKISNFCVIIHRSSDKLDLPFLPNSFNGRKVEYEYQDEEFKKPEKFFSKPANLCLF
jgi:hypothetical protein